MDLSSRSAGPWIPPLETVVRLQTALSETGVASVVGGSGLLASLGLTEEVHDWDLVIDAGTDAETPAAATPRVVETVEQVLDALGLPHRRRERSGIFHTAAAILVDAGDHSIDVLVGFALESPRRPGGTPGSGVVMIPARAGHRWRGLQMARPQEWILAYRLMGRTERSEALRRHLDL